MEGPGMIEAMGVAVGVMGNWWVPLGQLEVADIKAVGRTQGNTGLIRDLSGCTVPI